MKSGRNTFVFGMLATASAKSTVKHGLLLNSQPAISDVEMTSDHPEKRFPLLGEAEGYEALKLRKLDQATCRHHSNLVRLPEVSAGRLEVVLLEVACRKGETDPLWSWSCSCESFM